MNDEILGGLKAALERGQSLKSSMNSFLNSGYSRAEIEEAARALAEPSHFEQKIPETIIAPAPQKIPAEIPYVKPKKQFFKKLIPEKKQVISSPLTPVPKERLMQEFPEPVQERQEPVYEEPRRIIQRPQRIPKISYYDERTSTEKLLIIVLVSFLIFLIGVLIFIFVFRKDLINFFSSMFAQ